MTPAFTTRSLAWNPIPSFDRISTFHFPGAFPFVTFRTPVSTFGNAFNADLTTVASASKAISWVFCPSKDSVNVPPLA